MKFVCLASLVSAAAAVMTCQIKPGGDAQCRSCPATSCEIVDVTPDTGERTFSCVWPDGELVVNDKSVGRPPQLSWSQLADLVMDGNV